MKIYSIINAINSLTVKMFRLQHKCNTKKAKLYTRAGYNQIKADRTVVQSSSQTLLYFTTLNDKVLFFNLL